MDNFTTAIITPKLPEFLTLNQTKKTTNNSAFFLPGTGPYNFILQF